MYIFLLTVKNKINKNTLGVHQPYYKIIFFHTLLSKLTSYNLSLFQMSKYLIHKKQNIKVYLSLFGNSKKYYL